MAKGLVVIESPPIGSWDELNEKYKGFSSGGRRWIFRTDNPCEKPTTKNYHKILETSLDKEFKRFKIKASGDRWKIERNLIRSFRRKIPLYLNRNPDNLLEAMALLRHFGGPARMLDWVYSFFVAIYFAVNRADANNQIVVWALNNDWLAVQNFKFEKKFIENKINKLSKNLSIEKTKVNKVKEKLKSSNRRVDFELKFLRGKMLTENLDEYSFYKEVLSDPTDLSNEGLYYLMDHPRDFIYAVNPYYLNERLTIQQGVLLCSGDVNKTWGENLKGMMLEENCVESKDIKTVLRGFIIENKTSVIKDFLKRLYDMNITQATLFPDIGGFAESLKTKIAALWQKKFNFH